MQTCSCSAWALLILCILVFDVQPAHTQDRSQNIWMLGENLRIDFNQNPASITQSVTIGGTEAYSSGCDPATGELLLYSNGMNVFNAAHETLTETVDLKTGRSASQGVLIMPTGIGKRYFVFTNDEAENLRGAHGVNYSIVDMSLNDGRGAFVPEAININLLPASAEGLAATHHRDLCSFWLLMHNFPGDEFYAFRVADETIYPPVVSKIGPPLTGRFPAGVLKFSPDGKKVVYRDLNDASIFRIMDFDNFRGKLSNVRELRNLTYNSLYSFEFSPDSRMLYFTATFGGDYGIVRFDQLGTANNQVSVIYSVEQVAESGPPGSIECGPDGKLYCTIWGRESAMLIIDKPNALQPEVSRIDFPAGMQTAVGLPTHYSGRSLSRPGVEIDILNIDGEVNICQGETLELIADSELQGEIVWQAAPGIDDLRERRQLLQPQNSREYVVNYVSGCIVASDTVKVNVAPAPIVEVQSPPGICVGSSVTLIASGAETYSWEPAVGLDDPSSATPQASPLVTTTYTVTGENAEGCSATAEVTVVVTAELTLDAQPANPQVCKGRPVSVKIESDAALRSIRWDPETGVADPTAAETEINVSETTTYQVTAESVGGCVKTISVTVTIDEFAVAQLEPAQPQVCAGQDLQLRIGSEVDLVAASWSPTTGLSDPNILDPVVNLASSQSYTVTYESAPGCKGELEVFVEVFEEPQLTINKPMLMLCPGFSEVVTASGAQNYRWLDMDGNEVSNTAAWEVPVTQASGTFLLIGESADGCTAEAVFEFVRLRGVAAPPSAEFDMCFGESVQLNASGGVRYQWSPSAGLSDATIPDPIAAPDVTTEYKLEVFDSDGCSAETSVIVNVAPQVTVDLSLASPGQQIMPGDIIDLSLNVNFNGPPLQSTDPQTFEMQIACPDNALRLDPASISLSPAIAGWSVQAIQRFGENLLIVEGLSDGGPIPTQFNIQLQVLAILVSDFTAPLNVSLQSAELEFAPVCMSSAGSHELIWSEVCLQQQRSVIASGVRFGLEQNTPNPSTGSTQIRYSLGFDIHVQLLLTDNLGRVVKTLVDQRQAGGDYTLDLDLADLARGDYRYILRAGPFRESRLLLVR